MICLEDLVALKEQNEKTIVENDAIIYAKQEENVELAAENRVFDKLILVEKAKAENIEETIENEII